MNTVRKDTFNRTWRPEGYSWLKVRLWYFVNAIFFVPHWNPSMKLKVFLLNLFGAKTGKRCYVKPGVNIKYPWLLEIGDYAGLGENVWIDNLARVTIKDHVTISQGALLLTGNHNYKSTKFDLIVKEIILEDGVWIGAKAVVCPGVTCKSHSILTVGSVANKDLDPYTIYAGNPAQPVRKREIQ